MDGGDDDVVGMTQQMTQEVQTQVNMGTCQETAFQVEPWFFSNFKICMLPREWMWKVFKSQLILVYW